MRFFDTIRKLTGREPVLRKTDAGVLFADYGERAKRVGPLGLSVPGGFEDLPAPDESYVDRWTASAPCPTCHGSGAVNNPYTRGAQQCPNCGGSGSRDNFSRRFYDYVFPTATFGAALGTNQQVLTFTDKVPFEIYWIVAKAINSATLADALYAVSITDTGSSIPWTNQGNTYPVWGENFAGTAQLPFRLPEPYVVQPNGSLQAQFTERSNSADTQVQLVMRGYKLFPNQAQSHGRAGAIFPAGAA